MTSGLQPWALHAARRAWAERLGVPERALSVAGRTSREQPGLRAVVAVRLHDALVVVAPAQALERLEPLSSDELLDVAVVLDVLGPLADRPLGRAVLALADGSAIRDDAARRARPATEDDVVGACAMRSRRGRRERAERDGGAAAAVHRATARGLVGQWRARIDHEASRRVADRLGFEVVGEQIAIDLVGG